MIQKTLISLLVVIFGGIVLHAPISVGLGVLFPDASLLIKSWKELLLAVGVVLLVVEVLRQKKWSIFRNWLTHLIVAYIALHILLLPFFETGLLSKLAGLSIDLRYVVFFLLVFGTLKMYPSARKPLLLTFAGGAVLVVLFAVLQVTVLPYDFLKYFGYSTDTIAAYLTVDKNMDYIRINSTLRGPNPLGAYAGIVLAVTFSYWLAVWKKTSWKKHLVFSIAVVATLVTLWFSYSRSASVGALIAVSLVALLYVIVYAKKLLKPLLFSGLALTLIFGGVVFSFGDTEFVSHVILHEDPNEGNDVNSDDEHAESLRDGVDRMLRQPWGAGVGSTGSASLLGENSLIIENQYLFIAHEVGWLGLALFLSIFGLVLYELWLRRRDWLARATLASGIGLAAIGILLPVLADDTVSIIWWGLAAISLGGYSVLQKPAKIKKL